MEGGGFPSLFVSGLAREKPTTELHAVFQRLGAVRADVMDPHSRLAGCAFVHFPDVSTAGSALALFRSGALREWLGRRVRAEPVSRKGACSSDAERARARADSRIAPDLGINYAPDPSIAYAYPAVSTSTVLNIVQALVENSRFYTHVLHLMNRLNLPPPFPSASESADLSAEDAAQKFLQLCGEQLPAREAREIPTTVRDDVERERSLAASYTSLLKRKRRRRAEEAPPPCALPETSYSSPLPPPRPGESRHGVVNDALPTIYVKNLPPRATPQEIENALQQDKGVAKNVVGIRLFDRGRMRRQGFLYVAIDGDVERVLAAASNLRIRDRALDAELARSRVRSSRHASAGREEEVLSSREGQTQRNETD